MSKISVMENLEILVQVLFGICKVGLCNVQCSPLVANTNGCAKLVLYNECSLYKMPSIAPFMKYCNTFLCHRVDSCPPMCLYILTMTYYMNAYITTIIIIPMIIISINCSSSMKCFPDEVSTSFDVLSLTIVHTIV